MKAQINPVAAAAVVLIVLAAVVAWMWAGPSRGPKATVDTGLPPEVAARIREQGPRPMPPMPMPGGGVSNAPLPTGPPVRR
ncbi:MAG: hypothetical protein IT208_13040 [Chthonomonadales bacterium]|nr:hypothetical protein [Chthonomonadales bacterium]